MTKTTTNESGSNVFDTLYVDQIYGGPNDTLTINDPLYITNGVGITGQLTMSGNIMPDSDNSRKIGDNSTKFRSLSSTLSFQRNDYVGSAFTSSNIPSVIAGLTTAAPLIITNSAYQGLSNSFQFPQKGYYMITMDIIYDTGALSNILLMSLYLLSAATEQSYIRYDTFQNSPQQVYFGFWVDSLSDRFQIRMNSQSGITNFRIGFGRIMLCSGYE